MSVDNDTTSLSELNAALGADSPRVELAGVAARGGLRRVTEVERDDPASGLGITVAWMRRYLARPHADLGRAGPVCPFTPTALELDTVWLAEISDARLDKRRIVELLARYRELFMELEPRSGVVAINKAILVVFSHLEAGGTSLVDEVQRELKPAFVDLGLMLGEFHEANESPGLRNPAFRPLRSPIPMLAIRHMVESDLPFLKRSMDPPMVRASYLRSYLRNLGGTLRRNLFEQALAALLEAELQLRAGRIDASEVGQSEGAIDADVNEKGRSSANDRPI